ncbi:EF-hand 4 and Dynamin N domain containing protein [Trichuris trichiura]|uniref:EF-hand 4 and Dynamin N domain containing protein n=1 Tax=Trichuris trichiura TaxID=36087 RepID=A0A077ZFD6_TRITR|nr:EF-hand 4 and Dynamin N domain containing protein [Trichuris trichiura]
MAGNGSRKSKSKKTETTKEKALPMPQALAMYYKQKIRPAEEQLSPGVYARAPLTDDQITSMPSVMFIGEYSTGKTTLINHMLQAAYMGSQVAVGPTTDNFFILTHDRMDDIVPANRLAQAKHICPLIGLIGLKADILERCFVVRCRSELLRHLVVIDTPGIVSSLSDKANRQHFDYIGAIGQFARSCDVVVFVFDANKLNIGNSEVVRTLRLLYPVEDRLVFVINKADDLPISQLSDIRGNLAWSLSRLLKRDTAPCIFVGSFWDKPLRRPDSCRFFQQYLRAFYDHLRNVSENVHSLRLEEVVSRAREVDFMLPLAFVLRNLHFRPEDLPPIEKLKSLLLEPSLLTVPTVSSDALSKVEEFIESDLFKFKAVLPWRLRLRASLEPKGKDEIDFDWAAVVSEAERNDWRNEFTYLYPSYNHLDACQLRQIMINSGVSSNMQNKIWNLVDEDKDKLINENEFLLLRYLLARASRGKRIPDCLPKNCRPPLMKFKKSRRSSEKSEADDKKKTKQKGSKKKKKKKKKKRKKSKKKKSSRRSKK